PLHHRSDQFLIGHKRGFSQRLLDFWVLRSLVEHATEQLIECLFSRHRWHLFHDDRQFVEERLWINPRRLSGRILFRAAFTVDLRKFATVLRLHLPVKLAQWVEHDLVQYGLNGRVILWGIVHEDARHDGSEVGGRAHYAGNVKEGHHLSISARQS